MSNTTYMPLPSCCVCLNSGRYHVRADFTVHGYVVCSEHADLMDRCLTIADAIREVKRRKAIGGAV